MNKAALQISPALSFQQPQVKSAAKVKYFQFGIPAGFPSPADDHLQNSLDLNAHLIKHPAATFIAHVNYIASSEAPSNDMQELNHSPMVHCSHITDKSKLSSVSLQAQYINLAISLGEHRCGQSLYARAHIEMRNFPKSHFRFRVMIVHKPQNRTKNEQVSERPIRQPTYKELEIVLHTKT